MNYRLPNSCPSCGEELRVKRCACPRCEAAVDGDFALPVLCRLTDEEQAFARHLILSSGNLKELARLYEVSYPTVRNRLDALIERVVALEASRSGEAGAS
jgi:hypothetical protein